MSPRNLIVFFIIAVSINNIFAQNGNYLISIDLTDNNNLIELENLELPVYHRFSNVLITEASEPKFDALKSLKISFKILDENPNSHEYFIITSKSGEKIFNKSGYGDLLFDDESSILIKNFTQNLQPLVLQGLTIAGVKKQPNLFCSEKVFTMSNLTAREDSTILNVIEDINADSIEFFIQSLQDFGTRYWQAPNRDSVASWIKKQFEYMGYTDVVIDSFQYQGTWQKNVVATFPSLVNPDNIFVVGGHHDAITSSTPMVIAPGADDNGSGTAAVLEIARVLKFNNFQPEGTIKFVTFACEEAGLWGSRDYAQKALNSGMNILLMINHDMISYTNSSLTNSYVDINHYSGSEEFRDIAISNVSEYTVITPQVGSLNSAGSDSYSFWQRGFPAVYFEERVFSPYYHTNNDIITNYSMSYCREVIKASCATLISVMVSPVRISNLEIYDVGNGNSLLAAWSPNTDNDLAGYHIYVGESSLNYDSVYTTTDTTIIINSLEEGTFYYVGVTAFDLDGHESPIVEGTGTPYSIPLPPAGITDEPLWHEIYFYWQSNNEIDLLGYNIYRSTSQTGTYTKLNTVVLQDTFYTDTSPQVGEYYYYMVKAVDSMLHESENNDIIRSRAVSMDQGIILVDETADGTGIIFSPTDEEVDEFYNFLLEDFAIYEYDVIQEDGVKLADIGAHSTVIWHGDDDGSLSTSSNISEFIQQYLDYGGNLLYVGYLPSRIFVGNTNYPTNFYSGSFMRDYLKIGHVEKTFGSKFIGAQSIVTGYQSLYVDSLKTNSNTSFHLRNIESIEAATGGTEIYKYDTHFDSTTGPGIMKGLPVGVEYIGQDYKVVTLSFPLYYMNQYEAKTFINYVLNNKFDEQTGIEDSEIEAPSDYILYQNYPNPFNPVTTIKYALPNNSLVTLKVYDILGREVATLVDEEKNSGFYEVNFDGTKLSSGIYFYMMKVSNTIAGETDFIQTKKILLLK